MNTQNVNVKTAAQESSRKMGDELTVDQFTDLFCWVLRVTEGVTQPMEFTPPENSQELTLLNDNCADYVSVWVVDGYPVAAGAPMDHFFRVINPSTN